MFFFVSICIFFFSCQNLQSTLFFHELFDHSNTLALLHFFRSYFSFPFAMPTNGTENHDEPSTPIETILVDPDATIVELTGCRLRTIEGLEGLNQVEALNLRQNLIKRIENLSHLTTLKHLDLYDNHLEKIEGLEQLTQLTHLDISFSKTNERFVNGLLVIFPFRSNHRDRKFIHARPARKSFSRSQSNSNSGKSLHIGPFTRLRIR